MGAGRGAAGSAALPVRSAAPAITTSLVVAVAAVADLLWGLLLTALAWAGTVVGTLFGDWRARRRGEPIDRGWHWARPGDPDY